MNTTPVTTQPNTPPTTPAIETLRPFRKALLDLHTALLAAERAAVERENGRLEPSQLLQALLHDERWAWLRPLGGLVAGIDEAVARARRGEATLGEAELRMYAAHARRLLTGDAPGLGERYAQLVQDSPEVILAVGAVRRALEPIDARSPVV